jgi:desulfoferrodoxin (superoxide reductase-like protein)
MGLKMNEKAEIDDSEVEVEEEEIVVSEPVDEVETEDTEEVVVSIGEEAPPPEEQTHAPEWVRELRKTNRELQRQNRELQSKLQTTAQTETKPVVLGPKPKLEDHDYDADKFEDALAGWFERKRKADEMQAAQEAEVMNQQKAWKAKLDGYGKAKAELRVKDFEDAEAVAQELFNITQQGVMLQGADNPALVVYALGKNPKKAKELSDIKDPVKFAFAVAKLEKELKVTNRRAAPAPERIVSGTGRSSGAVDSTLERLREEAARTGNMTKVIQYRAQKRSAPK